MYAIIKIGGSQYRVMPQSTVQVDRIEGKVGDMVNFPSLLVAQDSQVTLGKDASLVQVVAKIVEQGRGEKIDILRFRAKSRYRKRRGFRPHITTLRIESIGNSQVKTKTTPKQKKPLKTRKSISNVSSAVK